MRAGGCSGRGVLAAARRLLALGAAGARAGAAPARRTWLSALRRWSAEGWVCAGTGGPRPEPFAPRPAGREGRTPGLGRRRG